MKLWIAVLSLLLALFGLSIRANAFEGHGPQAECEKKAEEFYRVRYQNSFEKGTTFYRPFFNENLHKCLVSVSVHGYRKKGAKVNSIYTTLVDLKAMRELGSLFQVYGANDSTPTCMMLNKPVQNCSHTDWEDFITRSLEKE